MKPGKLLAGRLSIVATIAFTATVHAANLTWDTVAGDGPTISAGGGSWDTSTVRWNDAGADVAWSQTSATAALHAAIFAGADGAHAIDVPVAIATRSLAFNNSGYTLSAAASRTITLNPATANGTVTVTLGAGVTSTIGTNVSVSGSGGSPLTIAGAGTLNITGTGARVLCTSNNLTLSSGPLVEVGSGGTLSTNSQMIIGTSTSSTQLRANGGTVSAGTTGTTASNQHNIVLFNATTAGAAELTISNGGSITNLGIGRVSSTGNPVGSGESGLRFGSTTSTTNAVNATVNLDGGTLSVARVYEGNTGSGLNSTFNFNGGLLKVTAGAGNAANYMTGLNTASVKSGGARIDTNGVETTIAQALLDGGGSGGLTKEGNGTLNLTGANTYTGATIINGGKLGITAPYSALTATTIHANARLRVTTGTTASSIPAVTVNTNGGIETNVGTYTIGQLAGLTVTDFNAAGDYKIDLIGTGIPTGDITVLTYTNKTGTGSPSLGIMPLGLVGSVEDTGSAIVIHAQVAQIWAAGTGDWDTATANWTSLASIYSEGNPVVFPEIAGTNTVTLTADRSPSSVAIANDSTSTYAFTGSAITGSTAVTKSGSGVATFDVANSYTGATTISGGGLIVNANNALGTAASGTTIASGAAIGLKGGVTYSTAEPISGSGVSNTTALGEFASVQRGIVQAISGNCTFAGPIRITASGITRFGTQSGGSLNLQGAITRADGVSGVQVLFRSGTDGDFVTLSNGGNNWDLDTVIFAGATAPATSAPTGVRLGTDNALPTGTSVVAGGGTTSSFTTLDLNGYDQELNGLTNSNGRLHIVNSDPGNVSTLTLNPTADKSNYTIAASLTVIEDGAGKVNLVKQGSFRQTLHDPNTYSGSTLINGGSLQLGSFVSNPKTGSIPNTTSMSIAAGANFDVSLLAGYTIPASMPVTLKIDPAGAGSAGSIKAAVDLDVNAAVVTLDPLATLDDPAYILAEYTNLTGSPQFASVTGLPSGYSIDYAHSGGTQIALVQNAAGGFTSWVGGFGLAPADQDPTDDSDNDGMENLLEFALNGDPSVSDSGILPALNVTATDFEFTFQRRDDSVSPETTQTFQWGSTLTTWPGSSVIPSGSATVGTAAITVSPGVPNDAVTDTVKVSIPKTEADSTGKLFGRLQVVK